MLSLVSSEPISLLQDTTIVPSLSKKKGEASPSHQCPECPQKLTSHNGLLRHKKRKHSNEYLFKCTSCTISFSTQIFLNQHLRAVHKKNCMICQEPFTSAKALQSHLHDEHPCPVCEKKFVLYKRRQTHIQNHLIPQKLSHHCTQCTKSFSYPSMLSEHLKVVHSKNCKICQEHFTSIEQLRSHIKQNHPCPKCKQKFIKFGTWKKHNCEKQRNIISCPDCPKTFFYPSDLKHHREVSHQFKCRYCNQQFITRELRSEHKKTLHQHQCHYCLKTHNKPSTLQKHLMQVHQKKCTFCATILTSSQQLKQHLKIEHPCPHCGKRFVYSKNAKEHLHSCTKKPKGQNKEPQFLLPAPPTEPFLLCEQSALELTAASSLMFGIQPPEQTKQNCPDALFSFQLLQE